MYFKQMNQSYFKNLRLPCIHKFIKRVIFENLKYSTQLAIDHTNAKKIQEVAETDSITFLFDSSLCRNKFTSILAEENKLNMNLKTN